MKTFSSLPKPNAKNLPPLRSQASEGFEPYSGEPNLTITRSPTEGVPMSPIQISGVKIKISTAPIVKPKRKRVRQVITYNPKFKVNWTEAEVS